MACSHSWVELLYTAPRHIYTQFTISLNDESQDDDDDDVEIEFMDGNEGDGKIFNQIHEIQNNGKLNVFEKFKKVSNPCKLLYIQNAITSR